MSLAEDQKTASEILDALRAEAVSDVVERPEFLSETDAKDPAKVRAWHEQADKRIDYLRTKPGYLTPSEQQELGAAIARFLRGDPK
jgi:hypothetical protein